MTPAGMLPSRSSISMPSTPGKKLFGSVRIPRPNTTEEGRHYPRLSYRSCKMSSHGVRNAKTYFADSSSEIQQQRRTGTQFEDEIWHDGS